MHEATRAERREARERVSAHALEMWAAEADDVDWWEEADRPRRRGR